MTQDWLWDDHYKAKISRRTTEWRDETHFRIQRKRHIYEMTIVNDVVRYAGPAANEYLLRDLRRKFRLHYNLTSWTEKRQ